MIRTTLAVVTLLAPHPAKPVPAQITGLTETCSNGWVWATVTVKVNQPGLYDLWIRDDYGTRLNDDGVTVDGSGSFDVSLPNPEQVDLFVTKSGSSVKVAERSTAAVGCTNGWS